MPFLWPWPLWARGLYLGVNGGPEVGQWTMVEEISEEDSFYSATAKGLPYGVTYNAQAFWIFDGNRFFSGIEYGQSYVNWHYQQDNSISDDDSWRSVKGKRKMWNAIFGVRFFNSKKLHWGDLYFGYGFKHSLDLLENINPDDLPLRFDGKSLKVGFSVEFEGFYRIGLEYIQPLFRTVSRDGTESDLPVSVGTFQYKSLENPTLFLYFGFNVTLDFKDSLTIFGRSPR